MLQSLFCTSIEIRNSVKYTYKHAFVLTKFQCRIQYEKYIWTPSSYAAKRSAWNDTLYFFYGLISTILYVIIYIVCMLKKERIRKNWGL